MREAEERRRLVMRLKGFSSTLRSRDLCKASARCEVGGGICSIGKLTFFSLIEQFIGRHVPIFVVGRKIFWALIMPVD